MNGPSRLMCVGLALLLLIGSGVEPESLHAHGPRQSPVHSTCAGCVALTTVGHAPVAACTAAPVNEAPGIAVPAALSVPRAARTLEVSSRGPP